MDYCRLNTVFVKMDECRREGNMLPTADGEYRLSSNVFMKMWNVSGNKYIGNEYKRKWSSQSLGKSSIEWHPPDMSTNNTPVISSLTPPLPPPPLDLQSSPAPCSVLYAFLVIIQWLGLPGLIGFHLIDKNHYRKAALVREQCCNVEQNRTFVISLEAGISLVPQNGLLPLLPLSHLNVWN